MKRETSIRKALFTIFKNMEPGTKFSGLDLKKMVVNIYPQYKDTYPDTILRVARVYHREEYKPFDRNKSIYI